MHESTTGRRLGFLSITTVGQESQRGISASYFSFLLLYVPGSSVSLLFLFLFHRLSQGSDEFKQEQSLYLKFEETLL